MREKPYSLAPLLTQREQGKQEAQASLAQARVRVGAGVERHKQLEAALRALAERRTTAAARSSTRGAELARRGAEDAHFAMQHAQLTHELTQAARALHAEQRALRLAELALMAAFVEHRVVEQHHASFREATRKQAQRAEDDELEDMQSSRHGAARLR